VRRVTRGEAQILNFCSQCGSRGTYRIPPGDDRLRFVCDTCHIIHYENPKMVVGCIPVWNDNILFCRRAIYPQYGKWTLPAGFLEKGESVEAGARRETLEEAGARVEALRPFALYNLTRIGQVYLIFRGRLVDPDYRAGEESLEVRLFKEDAVPWEDLAFPVIRETLHRYFEDRSTGVFPFHMGDITATLGAAGATDEKL
jgi:ADP-ribose pyrophosphatase YjhB (NUDIX family)